MVTLMLDSAALEIVLAPAEKALAVRKRSLTIARTAIVRVQLTDDPWTWLRGVRSPGTYIPATLAAGTWRYAGGKDFALIRRNRPGVVIDLEGHDEFQRVILSTRHGLALVRALRLEGHAEPEDVAEIVAAPAKKPRAAKPRPATA
ncbi:MAG: hypothetical protein NT132_09180 [Microbacterium sp.]|uniref:hypothetical protein n=1 Tax=Microbacterium sp. TaxID=51671 RepID=UPI00261EB9D5|nr:hypothetical protein [Microbacterium sp.]MCX6502558.1 hypothetical protein [Microbacterium sp.]